MGYRRRLNRAFADAPVLPVNESTRYILMSDCHRGTGTTYDTFMKNRHLFLAAMQYYYRKGYHYIELGDGDELWENRHLSQIRQCHEDCAMWWKCFSQQDRAHSIYGNHDIAFRAVVPEATLLKSAQEEIVIGLVHGHQADFFNSTLWPISAFLVRYIWKPLERLGMSDPTQASKNYRKSGRVERRLENWAKENQITLISGHTHRAKLPGGTEQKPETEGTLLKDLKGQYLNTGSCVHPYGIMGIELNGYRAVLVKWRVAVREGGGMYVERVVV